MEIYTQIGSIIFAIVIVGYIIYMAYFTSGSKIRATPFRDLREEERKVLESMHEQYKVQMLLHPFFKQDLKSKVVRLENGRVHTGGRQQGIFFPVLRLRLKHFDNMYNSANWDFKIEGYEFNKYNSVDKYKTVVSTLRTGDTVYVEFSPNSGYIWKIEKK